MHIQIECSSGREFDLGECGSKVEAYIAVNQLVLGAMGSPDDEDDEMTMADVMDLIEEVGVYTEAELPFTAITVELDHSVSPAQAQVQVHNLPDGLFRPLDDAPVTVPDGLITTGLVWGWWSTEVHVTLGDFQNHFGQYYGVEEEVDDDAPLLWFGFFEELEPIIKAKISEVGLEV